MPLPIAHSAAGLAGYVAFKKANPDSPPKQELFLLVLCLFLANLPDLDFIPSFLCGDAGRFHHGPSHSLVVGLIATLIFYRFASHWLTGISKKRAFGCCLLSLLSHPILDYFSADTSKPFGAPLFWPLSQEYFIFPHPILPPVMHLELDHATIGQFLDGVFSIHNLYVVLLKIVMTIPFMLTFLSANFRRN